MFSLHAHNNWSKTVYATLYAHAYSEYMYNDIRIRQLSHNGTDGFENQIDTYKVNRLWWLDRTTQLSVNLTIEERAFIRSMVFSDYNQLNKGAFYVQEEYQTSFKMLQSIIASKP